MLDINISLVVQIVNFLILIFVLNAILYRPIRNVLLQRKEKFEGLERDVENAVKEAKDKGESFSEGIKEARQRGVTQRDKLIEAGESQEKEIIKGINERAQADLREFKQQLADKREEVRAALLKEVDNISKDIGKKILGRAV